MSFLQKNKTVIVVLLMVGFLIVILSIFFSGISGSDANATPTDSQLQLMNLATSTGNAPSGTLTAPNSSMEQAGGGVPSPALGSPPPGVTAQAVTAEAIATPPGTDFVATEPAPGTDAPPPPTVNVVDEGPPGTDFPPPLTFVPLPTETPPAGNGPPPGS
jgi:hypothetical protein